ncbi:MAG: GAF domain-containing protein, partial [Bradyrhizobium sp.]
MIERAAAIERQTANALVNFRLQNELRAATERQQAGAEILRTIASAPGDASRSLQQIAETCARLFGAPSVSIQLVQDGQWGEAVRYGTSAQHIRSAVPLSSITVSGPNMPGQVVGRNEQINVPDLDNIDPSMAEWPGLPRAHEAGSRTMCGTPLRREGKAIGALIIYRDRPLPFTPEELALQQTFADQAAIAIENARLFNATKEALERQTATAEVLQVISRSAFDLRAVLQTLVEIAAKLCRADAAQIYRREGEVYRSAAIYGKMNEAYRAIEETGVISSGRDTLVGRVALEARPVQIADAWNDPEYRASEDARIGNVRSMLGVPLVRDGELIGTFALARDHVETFSDREIDLVRTFADQAVIAIENVRLFNETKQALERQIATADILKVIASSPSDTTPVFEAIASSANRLLAGFSAAVFRLSDGIVHVAAFTPTNPAADEALKADFPKPVDAFEPIRLTRPGEPFPITDTEEVPYIPIRDIARLNGFRSMLFVPLMNGGLPIGVISVTRTEPGAFAPHHV